jgi:hypothetical protein
MDNKELHKTLLTMKKRVKEFCALRSECCWRDREDGFSDGWLSTEIYKFEKDMKNLVDEALKVERKPCNG